MEDDEVGERFLKVKMKQPTPKASTATLSRGRCLCMGTCSREAAAWHRPAAPPQSAPEA